MDRMLKEGLFEVPPGLRSKQKGGGVGRAGESFPTLDKISKSKGPEAETI